MTANDPCCTRLRRGRALIRLREKDPERQEAAAEMLRMVEDEPVVIW